MADGGYPRETVVPSRETRSIRVVRSSSSKWRVSSSTACRNSLGTPLRDRVRNDLPNVVSTVSTGTRQVARWENGEPSFGFKRLSRRAFSPLTSWRGERRRWWRKQQRGWRRVGDSLQPRSFINSTPGGDITRDITYAWTGLQTTLRTGRKREREDNRT